VADIKGFINLYFPWFGESLAPIFLKLRILHPRTRRNWVMDVAYGPMDIDMWL
jgi:hypothetical protein